MATEYEGRLELTWTNKALRLLAHDDGSYQWVGTADYRVAEVRLLHEVKQIGDSKHAQPGNLLIQGDALNALTSLTRLPQYARSFLGRVKLAYLDPPFNTQQSFLHYDDALEHSVWLTMMRDRLSQVRDLLAPDGSVWVHLDESEVHRARCMMDELFGTDCYVTTVVWQKADSPRMDAKQFSSSNDFILVYSKAPGWEPNRFIQQPDDEADPDETSGDYPYIDEEDNNRRFKSAPLRKWGKNSDRKDRPNLWYAITAPDGSEVWPIKPDGHEGNWRWSRDKVTVDWHRLQWIDKGSGLQPYVKTYEDEDKRPRPPETWWSNVEVGHNREAKAHIKQLFGRNRVFDTPKPERLLERILFLGTNEGDLVLDCFLGSGTTAAVAHKMGRHWIGIERSADTIADFALPRLTKVVDGQDSGGVTRQLGWTGGGGFRVLEVAPSMFVADDGVVLLADWMTNGTLAEATAAQMGFDFKSDPPFSGSKGRSRLAVIDGIVNEAVVRLLAAALPPQQRVVICGTGIDPEARSILRDLSPGSTMRKIPSALLDEYRLLRPLNLLHLATGDAPTSGTEVTS